MHALSRPLHGSPETHGVVEQPLDEVSEIPEDKTGDCDRETIVLATRGTHDEVKSQTKSRAVSKTLEQHKLDSPLQIAGGPVMLGGLLGSNDPALTPYGPDCSPNPMDSHMGLNPTLQAMETEITGSLNPDSRSEIRMEPSSTQCHGIIQHSGGEQSEDQDSLCNPAQPPANLPSPPNFSWVFLHGVWTLVPSKFSKEIANRSQLEEETSQKKIWKFGMGTT